MKTQIVNVTPEMAKNWIDNRGVEFQRAVSKSRVNQYADEIKAGRWEWGAGGPIEFVKSEAGEFFLINGQHRLAAVVKSEIAVEFLVVFHDGDKERARKMYSVYDMQTRRKFRDVWGNDGLSLRDRSMLGSALAIIICLERSGTVSVTNISTSERISIADEWAEYFTKARDIYSSDESYRKFFENGPVQAAMMYTLRYSPARAKSFWMSVVSGDTGVGSPQRVMREFIISHRKRQGEAHSYLTQMMRASACSICWNAFMRGDEIKQLKPNSVKTISLIGTPLK